MRYRLRFAAIVFLPVMAFVMTYISFSKKTGETIEPDNVLSPIRRVAHDVSDSEMTLPQGDKLRILAVGIDNTGQLADVILYAVINSNDNSLNVLQLPRDIYIGGSYRTGKLNEACLPFKSDAPAARIEEILEKNFCLPVDVSVCVTMAGVRKAVDLVGGIPINMPQEIEYLPDKKINAGQQVLNGEQTEWLLRCRSEYENADLGRLSMQKVFLQAVFAKFKTIGTFEAISLATNVYPYIKASVSLSEISSLLPEVSKLSSDDITFAQVPVYGAKAKGLDVLCINRHRLAETLNETVRKDDHISPWDLYLSYPPEPDEESDEDIITEKIQDREETRFDFSWYEDDNGYDSLEGVIRRTS